MGMVIQSALAMQLRSGTLSRQKTQSKVSEGLALANVPKDCKLKQHDPIDTKA